MAGALIMKTFGMKGLRWQEIPLMFLFGLCSLWVWDWTAQYYRNHQPFEEYFEILQLAVPDHLLGENPVLAYERVIHKTFYGHWHAEVQTLETYQAVCVNGGDRLYDVIRKQPVGGFTLDWFMDTKCNLPAGSYRMEACWIVDRINADPITKCLVTAPFTIHDPNEILEKTK